MAWRRGRRRRPLWLCVGCGFTVSTGRHPQVYTIAQTGPTAGSTLEPDIDAGRLPSGQGSIVRKQLSRWRVVEMWLAAWAAFSAVLAVADGAPTLTTVSVLVTLSLVPAASVLLWWPQEQQPLPLDVCPEPR